MDSLRYPTIRRGECRDKTDRYCPFFPFGYSSALPSRIWYCVRIYPDTYAKAWLQRATESIGSVARSAPDPLGIGSVLVSAMDMIQSVALARCYRCQGLLICDKISTRFSVQYFSNTTVDSLFRLLRGLEMIGRPGIIRLIEYKP